jgi:hypothetical protein
MSDPNKPLPDDDFERDLAALTRAYGKAGREEPPAALDAAIRAAARRAVHAGPQARRRSWVSQWATPVATAAVLVLTVSIGLVSYRERPDLATTGVRSDIPPRPQAPAAVPAEKEAPAADFAVAPGPARPVPAQPAPASPAPMPFKDVGTATGKLKAQAPAAASEEAPRGREAEIKERPAAPPAPEPAAAPAPAASAVARDSAVLEKRSFAAPAAQAPAATPAAPARAEMQSGERAAPAAGLNLQRAKKEVQADRTPEAWIKEIRELQRDGKNNEALEELEKFRKRFPDYALPPELKDLR